MFLVLIFVCLNLQIVVAQTVSQNQNGEKIVLYSDGSWRYFDEDDPNDIALLGDVDKNKKTKKDKVAKVKTPKPKKSKKDKDKKKYAKQSKSKKLKKDKSVAKSKKNKGRNSYTSITSGQNYKRIVNKEILDIRDKQNMAFEKERIANYATQKYNKELSAAKKRKLDKTSLKSIEAKLKEAKLRLKLARNQNKVLLKQRRSYEALLRKDPSLYAKEYAKLANKYNKDFESVPILDEEQLVVSEASKKPKTRKKSKVSRKSSEGRSAKTSKAQNDGLEPNLSKETFESEEEEYPSRAYQVAYPSSKPNVAKASIPACNIVFEGKDSFSGKKRTDLGKSPFFSFTNDKVRTYFEEGDMIECEAYMSAVAGGYKFICIEVTVASETAQRSYGSIEKQGLLSIKLVDGTTVNLYNNKTDYGFLDPIKKKVLYKAQYLIPNEHVKTLSKIDIDMVRLVWSTGYEDYTIYETDFLINQLACLSK